MDNMQKRLQTTSSCNLLSLCLVRRKRFSPLQSAVFLYEKPHIRLDAFLLFDVEIAHRRRLHFIISAFGLIVDVYHLKLFVERDFQSCAKLHVILVAVSLNLYDLGRRIVALHIFAYA